MAAAPNGGGNHLSARVSVPVRPVKINLNNSMRIGNNSTRSLSTQVCAQPPTHNAPPYGLLCAAVRLAGGPIVFISRAS